MTTADGVAAGAAPEPAFRVVSGTPTDEELAALVVVLAARSGATAVPEPEPGLSGWTAYARAARHPLAPGPHAWRLSARTR